VPRSPAVARSGPAKAKIILSPASAVLPRPRQLEFRVVESELEGLAMKPAVFATHPRFQELDLGWAIDVLHPAANPAAYRPAEA
jgi:hypothetical protein